MTTRPLEKWFDPEELVPVSGVYWCFHSGNEGHHETVLKRGARFHRCAECGGMNVFRLLRVVPYIYEDADFRGSQ